jgi:dolichol-phosphate mannosyltransferase
VTEGALATTAPIVAVIDADLQHDEQILPALIAAVASGSADVAIGSRYHPEGSCSDWSGGRAWGSRMATGLARLAVGSEISDPMSGFFALRQELLVELAPRLSRRGFKILLDILASAGRPLRVREIPYHFRQRRAGMSKLGPSVVIDYLRLLASRAVRRAIGGRAPLTTSPVRATVAIYPARNRKIGQR